MYAEKHLPLISTPTAALLSVRPSLSIADLAMPFSDCCLGPHPHLYIDQTRASSSSCVHTIPFGGQHSLNIYLSLSCTQSTTSPLCFTMLFPEVPIRHTYAFNLLALVSILGMCLADFQASRSHSPSSTSSRSTFRRRHAPPRPLTGMPRRSSELVSMP